MRELQRSRILSWLLVGLALAWASPVAADIDVEGVNSTAFSDGGAGSIQSFPGSNNWFGSNGIGSITVTAGSEVSGGRIGLGRFRSDAGVMIVDDGTVDLESQLFIGREGSGTMVLQNGTVLTVQATGGGGNNHVGLYQGASGTLIVRDGAQFIGNIGAQNLDVGTSSLCDGGAASGGPGGETDCGATIAGDPNASTTGTVAVYSGGKIYVGQTFKLGTFSNTNAQATVHGAGSLIEADQRVVVGSSQPHLDPANDPTVPTENTTGSLSVLAGGEVRTWAMHIGEYAGSSGQVHVSGSGSKLRLRGNRFGFNAFMNVGLAGYGALLIEDGGSVEIACMEGALPCANGPTGFQVGRGQTGENAGNPSIGNGTLTVHGPDSELRVETQQAFFTVAPQGSSNGSIVVLDGGSVVLENGDGKASGSIGSNPTTDGSLVVRGAASLVDAGELFFCAKDYVGPGFTPADLGYPGGSGRVVVRDGGTLMANHIVIGASCVASGDGTYDTPDMVVDGTLLPGNSPGVMIINGNLSLTPSAKVIMEVNGTGEGEFDQLVVNGSIVADPAATISVIVDQSVDLSSTEVTLIAIRGDDDQPSSDVTFEITTTDQNGAKQTQTVVATANDTDLTLAFGEGGTATVFANNLTIDVKPGSDDNSINLSSSGVIPVAILSVNGLDAPAMIDPNTIELNGAKVKMVGKSSKSLCHSEDVNDDSRPDLVCQVLTEGLQIEEGVSEALLTANTFNNSTVEGVDIVRIVPD